VAGPLLIADVPWLLYRSFFALPKSITDGDGHPVNALLGTVNALLGAIDSLPAGERVRAVVACMGAEQAAYRVELYPPYHAHREPMPAELAWQWRVAPQLLESFGWIVASSETLEADDVMFSFATAEEASGGRALLITGDRDLLFDAIANLVDNAIKHGREAGRVEVRLDRRDNGTLISVADNGPGIPVDERQHVFRRFYRLECSRRTSGNGLGLSLVAAVARRHDGRVELFDNAPGLKVEMWLRSN